MRISLVLLFAVVLQLSAENGYAQKIGVAISMSNASIEQVLNRIEETSDYVFLYNDKTIQTNRIVSVSNKSGKILDILDEIFRGTNVTYTMVDKQIILSTQKLNVTDQSDNKILLKGLVKDAGGEPLIGVNVKAQGASGTITDINGNFSIQVKIGESIEFSYVGYVPQIVKVTGNQPLNIILQEDNKVLSEVVVTALGIKREAKALTYNVQELKSDAITGVKDASFVTSLQGKIAGVTINQSANGIGGSTRVVMRGTKSLFGDNNALYVVDGIPLSSMRSEQPMGSFEVPDGGDSDGISSLNPDDIETMSVLTGAAAAALYGAAGANGVVLITTKKGTEGKLSVSYSNDTQFLMPFVMPKFQNTYGRKKEGVFESWGNKLATPSSYDPKDFFQTGFTETNSLSVTSGTDRNQTYFSASSINAAGIIPNNKYNRYNFTFRNTTSFLNDKMKLDVSASYILQNDRNMTNQGQYSNPLVSAYLFPRGDDFSLIKNFERWDEARKISVQFWPQGEGDLRMQNPYWIAYRNLRLNNKKRYMASAGLSYQILDWLNVAGRVRIDNTHSEYEGKLYASTSTTLTDGSTQGHYTVNNGQYSQTYADVLVNINKRIQDFTIVANIGASYSGVTSKELGYAGPIRDTGIPNLFNVYDLDNAKKRATQVGWREATESVFASAEVGWKSMLYLTLTGRNDWASQLTNSPQASFFYPSVGLSAVISEMVKLPEWIDYLKVRGSFSSVGTPYPRFLTYPTYAYDANKQDWKSQTHYPIGKLYPERTDSWEIGLDATLWKDLKVSGSFYYANTYNQTFDPQLPVSSGYDKLYVQTGYVRNYGFEAMLSYGHRWGDFGWDSSFTFSTNKNEIVELVKDYIHPESGKTYNVDKLELKTDEGRGFGKAKFILKEGGTLGDLYTHADLKRDINGNILVDNDGNVTAIDNAGDIKLGSVLPKANLAWNNSFSYKGVNVGFLLTARLGGIAYSATQAYLDLYGVSETSAAARDAGGVWINGRSRVNPQGFYSVVASQSGLPTYYTYSATNLRLQEARIGYTIPRRWLGNVCDVNVSLVGKNLWMIYCKAPFDPEAVATTNNYYQGIDYFMMPSTRNIGFNIKINF